MVETSFSQREFQTEIDKFSVKPDEDENDNEFEATQETNLISPTYQPSSYQYSESSIGEFRDIDITDATMLKILKPIPEEEEKEKKPRHSRGYQFLSIFLGISFLILIGAFIWFTKTPYNIRLQNTIDELEEEKRNISQDFEEKFFHKHKMIAALTKTNKNLKEGSAYWDIPHENTLMILAAAEKSNISYLLKQNYWSKNITINTPSSNQGYQYLRNSISTSIRGIIYIFGGLIATRDDSASFRVNFIVFLLKILVKIKDCND